MNLILTLSGYDSISSNNNKHDYLVFPHALATFSKNSSQVSLIYVLLLIIMSIIFFKNSMT